MKRIAFGLLFLISQITFAQIDTGTLETGAEDSIHSLAADSMIFEYPQVTDTMTQLTDTMQKKFIVQAHQFLDSVKHEKEAYLQHRVHNIWNDSAHSPGKAALFSALLPGLGQAYNGKWWKIPIVYAGLGTATGFVIYNTYGKYGYLDLKRALILRFDGDSTTIDQYASDPSATDDALLQAADDVKRYLDISYIVTAFVYLLNIIDAVVDAQLFNFDVSDDLTMRIDPFLHYNTKNTTANYSSFRTPDAKPVFGIQINLHIQ